MMDEELIGQDFQLILTPLEFMRTKFENTNYPTYKLRKSQLDRVNKVIAKVRALQEKSSRNLLARN